MELDVEKGRIIDAPVHWVHFVLSNVDIMTRLTRNLLKVKEGEARTFTGSIFGLSLRIEVLGDQQPSLSGEVDLVADVRLRFGGGRTHSVVHHRYRAIDERSTMLDMRFHFESNGLVMATYMFFIKRLVNKYISRIMKNYNRAAVALSSNNRSLVRRLDEDQMQRVRKYQAACKAGSTTAAEHSEREGEASADRNIWDGELRELASLYEGYEDRKSALSDELARIHLASDAVGTLLVARRMLEVIVTQMCETFLPRPRGTEPLAMVIDKLDQKEDIPDYICTSMRNLNRLSTYGAHPKDFSPRQVREALIALCSVVEWYISHMSEPSG